MTNDEIRRYDKARMTKRRARAAGLRRHWPPVIYWCFLRGAYFVIRHSSFVIRSLGVLLALGLVQPFARAHIGSPDVFYEGYAGPYPVRVTIRPPPVIPGRAEITVRVGGPGVRRVTALPVVWNAGRQGAPPPDVARPVRGETNLFSAELWLMVTAAHSVYVDVEGGLGSGTA